MITLPPDFRDFLQLLNENEVEYLLIGGYAVALHGYVRFTQDLDVWILSSVENADKIVKALREFGFSEAGELRNVFLQRDRVVAMGIPPMKIEVVTSIDGVEFEACFKNKLLIDLDGLVVPYLSLSDLRVNKTASGRFKDLNDLEHLPES